MKEPKRMQDTIVVKSAQVFPPDTNYYGTLFGGKLMAHIDDVASISATRFARNPTVTASTDSVDFIRPIKVGDTVTLKAMVTHTGRSSMEVFVRVISENLITGAEEVAAISFLTFVALNENGQPVEVGSVVPESEEEKWLSDTAPARAAYRKTRKDHSKELALFFKKI
ncbi:acyl-CoA thioesterase [Domibacillus sp. A3M-37]|uniref:acyl-CoA thioesterase n=1 Tax=Domibacillus TaxID=1433999 RepID=UPI00061833B2|nr:MULTISPECIES: acyl-CoA thioesterase [Domibacillus]MCP3762150.1 acyl-CoA thioesterase [Domibacillus sp. A3M-37]